MTRIICHSNELEGDRWVGKTVAQIREELGPVLNISQDALVRLNEQEGPAPSTVLQSGDELEFIRPSGQKG